MSNCYRDSVIEEVAAALAASGHWAAALKVRAMSGNAAIAARSGNYEDRMMHK